MTFVSRGRLTNGRHLTRVTLSSVVRRLASRPFALPVLIAVTALGGYCGSNVVQAHPARGGVVVRVGSSDAPGSIPGRAELLFAKDVRKYSHGQVTVTVYPNSELGSFPQMATEMKTGSVNSMFIQPDALGVAAPLAQVDAWPFMFSNAKQMVKAWRSKQGKELVAAIEKTSGYYLTAPTWNTPRNIFLNETVPNLRAARGMKVRVPGENVYLDEMKLLGLSPVGMDIAEVYTGMQQNVVNGMEATWPDAVSFSLQDVSKTVLLDGHVIAPKMWLFWGQWLKQLSPANRKAVLHASRTASAYYSRVSKAEQKSIIKSFKAKGVRFAKPGVSLKQLRRMEAPLARQLPQLAAWAKRLEKGA